MTTPPIPPAGIGVFCHRLLPFPQGILANIRSLCQLIKILHDLADGLGDLLRHVRAIGRSNGSDKARVRIAMAARHGILREAIVDRIGAGESPGMAASVGVLGLKHRHPRQDKPLPSAVRVRPRR